MKGVHDFLHRATAMYVEGFRNMTIGRSLWLIILIKLFIFFAILKLFFFPDVLATNYDTDDQRAEAVREALATPKTNQTSKSHNYE